MNVTSLVDIYVPRNNFKIAMQNTLNFENTQIAFSSKSTTQLKKAEWLFSVVKKAWLTNLAKSITNFLLRIGFPIEPILKQTVFEQFCGGETIVQCEGTVNSLFQNGGVHSILDYSIEGKETENFFDGTLETMLKICKYGDGSPEVPFLVFKPTGMGRFKIYEKVSTQTDLNSDEALEWERIQKRFDAVCSAVANTNFLKIMVDAEESWIQDAIDTLVEEMMVKYNTERTVVFNTVQMYRWDRLSYLQRMYSFGQKNNIRVGVKLVRGAYMEKERERAFKKGYISPICEDKRATDINFDEGIHFCLNHLDVFDIFAGSHNEMSCQKLSHSLKEEGISKDDERIWFGQLYGMSDHISFNLANSGYNTAKYVPFGPVREVVPYLFRRAEENTSVGSQTSRELFFIKKELLRRKNERE
jgi:proline dehydrogenase